MIAGLNEWILEVSTW